MVQTSKQLSAHGGEYQTIIESKIIMHLHKKVSKEFKSIVCL